MSAAQIVIVQEGSAGAPGVSRDDLVTGEEVTFQNADDTGVRTWRWRMVDKPTGSAAVLSAPTAAEVTFTPDISGSYMVELVIDEGQLGQIDRRLAVIRDDFGGILQVRVPAAGEDNEANWGGNDRGWMPDLELWLKGLANRLDGTVSTITEFGAVGDGVTDDTTAIQDAIDAAFAAGGGTVIVPRGTFIFTTLTLRTNVHIEGTDGEASILKIADHISDQDDDTAYYFLRANAQNNIRLAYLTFDGNQDTNRPVSEGPNWVADILTITGDNIVVENCRFRDAPDSAIMFAQCTNSRVSACFIDNSPDLGIYYNDTLGTVALNNLINDNTITRCQFGAIGIKRNASSLTVESNTIRDCGNGITVEDFGSGNHPVRVSILDNRLERIGHSYPSAAQCGITVQAAHGTIVQGNYIDDVVGFGIGVDGCDDAIVTGNYVRCTASGSGTTNRGILISPRNSQGCRRCVISENIVRGARAEGFRALTGSGNHQFNSIRDNMFQSSVSDGLRVDSNFLDNDVTDNRLDGAASFDLNINISSGTVVRNHWSNNRLQNGTRNGFVDVQTAGIVEDYGTRRVAMGTTAPSVGTWNTGDIVYNTTPGTDTVMLWECTAGGTPGTWLGKKGVPASGTLTLGGNLSLPTIGQRIDLGDGVTNGNVTIRRQKADTFNFTGDEWYSAGSLQWLIQLDTSENLNILDNAAALVMRFQRTAGDVEIRTALLLGTSASSSPVQRFRKTAAGTSTLGFRTSDSADTTNDKRIQHNASEELVLDHWTGAAWETLMQLTATVVRLPTLASQGGCILDVGDATGVPLVRVRKAAAADGTFVFTTGTGNTDGDKQFLHDSSEDLLIQARVGGTFGTQLRIGSDEVGLSVPLIAETGNALFQGEDDSAIAGGSIIVRRGVDGGDVNIAGGNGLTGNTPGGPVSIEGGDGIGTEDGGAVSIIAGAGGATGDGGNLTLSAGGETAGAPGTMRMLGRRADIDSESPATMSATENDYNPGGAYPAVGVLRLTPAGGGTTMNGLVAGVTGQRLTIINDSTTDDINLANLNGGSGANNQFRCPNSATFTIRDRGAVDLIYHGAKWQVIAG